MMSIRQGDESFRQFSLRVQRRLEQFQKLAVNENCDLVKTLVKYLILESCSNDMRTFLIEHKVSALTIEDFQEIGVAYQEAHGKPIKSTEKSKKMNQEAQTGVLSLTQIWKISLEKNYWSVRSFACSQTLVVR